MKYKTRFWPLLVSLLLFGSFALAQNNLTVDVSQSVARIQPTMYGIFYEDINFAADGGLYPEMIKNRSFEFDEPMMGWQQPNSVKLAFNPNSGYATVIKSLHDGEKFNFCRVEVNNPDQYVIINEGFRGMGIRQGAHYDLTLRAAKRSGNVRRITLELIDDAGNVLGAGTIIPTSKQWANYATEITATKTEAKAKLRITFSGKGELDLDMISLFPQDTWKNRKNGLRKDLVQLLYDLRPGFLRFPGGCIVEGRTLAKRYQWKKTVGPVGERATLVNRWNTEFNHRLTPDYYQSFGLGFFEYFQLSEDLGAEPLPILGCGMACQFNTGELVPMDELDPYVQDALDLIEFANGPVDSPWGKVRADMGHPKPFNMKYIGIGNEQWGPEYIKRYKVFAKALKDAYPDIVLVSTAGPFPDGDFFEYGMGELVKLDAELVDEHYYRPPSWFRENADRYDDYDRNGPKIFAGEYAAQSVEIASPNNKNNWETALSEAAFMTGLERNADLVHLTSYAPLMAHADGWQWTPDMIWFNNLESIGTPNYYVQKLFANHPGTDLLRITRDGEQLSGQNDLYASAVKDAGKNELIIKLVNTAENSQKVKVDVEGGKPGAEGKFTRLRSDDLSAENSFESPRNVYPTEGTVRLNGNALQVELPAHSLSVFRVSLD
ncbi:alpha-L-arabinofuranosidase C-terminal domain-containing protein [Flavilitoribacter nigricans]|uniref:non-reducing end alpha-L-arabinofuranosidase n=1 Tax=Flavilitoribacter nigricans (strain ATCC 23147 / DSM 23189 / NBRC 102662 / NCIMB 1420 / SS-2) TaxID=1122177 RepID=A0A2D0N218_FLAN2|nr:alpha-L-arabinofuranosidase C-terminal domain-containing protein [Flavilitoribacter nigricans]PHN02460.1 alpha-L-arabinofuranosidase [Flavilitoribacter nigricans DSM 23189 = NBRC 102662]